MDTGTDMDKGTGNTRDTCNFPGYSDVGNIGFCT